MINSQLSGRTASPILSAWPGRLARCGRQDRYGCETAGNQQAAGPVPQGVKGGQGQDFGSGGGHHGDGRLDSTAGIDRPEAPDPAEQVDRRTLRTRGYSDDARALLEHVWTLMGMPCGKYLVLMLEQWLPLPAAAGDLDKTFATGRHWPS